MKKIVTLLLSAVMILAVCIPAFAAEAPEEAKDYDPVLGSWKLNTVFNVADGQDPEEIEKETAQSLYGTGINIITFDEDGYAHDILFAGPDTADYEAHWESSEPNVYIYEEDGMEITFTYDEENDALHRSFENSDEDAVYPELDFVYARAIVGSWKLDQVLEIHEGDAPVEMAKEENQSLYAEADNTLSFYTDGIAEELIKDGADETIEEGTWKMTEPDKFVYTIGTLETEMVYFRVDDALFRDVITEEGQPYFRFIYTRADKGRYVVDIAQDGSPIYSDDPRIDYIDEDGFAHYKLPEDAVIVFGEDPENGEPYVIDYAQDGTPIYSDDPRIDYIDEDGFPRYKPDADFSNEG